MAEIPSEPLEIREFPGAGDPAALLPPRTQQNAPFFAALADGALVLQSCARCGRGRWPIGPVCPYCAGRVFEWRRASGDGTVHSWVRYRRGYLREFEPLMPYVLLCVALEDGPRIFGRLAGPDAPEPWIGMAVRAIVERLPGGACVHAFEAATG